ncbi:acyltransferase family protein [Sphingomonas sp. G-3-2-10]|uniref:acyltransferase family protein n=1 Tax=Sphingomonas sp. G-3-2-10 TaxID=2728838 RepID=UPI00146A45C8|nr:acyltransferase family protein [Sphingomonas sp. G-3-2-10]NML06547.1 acyltransferase family protein [Sphingomonas sp. G-3-2-10]
MRPRALAGSAAQAAENAMTSPEANSGASERLHALDAVRAGALLLGVAFHASLSFLPGPQIWVVRDTPSEAIATAGYVAHIFRMAAFFVIAGYFGRMLLQRRGTGGFVRNRVTRIVMPLLSFWTIVMAGIIACFIWGAAVMNGGTLPTDGPPPPPLTIATFPLTHLWFLYLLTLFYVAALAIRGIASVIDRKGSLRAGPVDGAMRGLLATPAGAIVLAVPLSIALAAKSNWFAWGGIPTPDTGLVPNIAATIAYGTAFTFGWLLQRQPVLLGSLKRWWPVHLIGSVALTIACCIMIDGISIVTPMPEGDLKSAYAYCYALAVWTWTLGLIGAALHFLTAENRAIRYVADASYWIYLIHLPVVMALQVMVFTLPLPALAKWGIVITASFLILLASYHLLVRHSWIGKWLNGRKLPWRKPAAGMEMQAA